MGTAEILYDDVDEKVSRRRLQLDFSSEAYNKLQEIKTASDSKSNAEVIRNALRLYAWVLEQRAKNFDLQLVKGGVIKEVEILL